MSLFVESFLDLSKLDEQSIKKSSRANAMIILKSVILFLRILFQLFKYIVCLLAVVVDF